MGSVVQVQGALARKLDRIKENSIHILPSLVIHLCLLCVCFCFGRCKMLIFSPFNLYRVAGIAAVCGEEAASRRGDSQQSEIGLAKKFPGVQPLLLHSH
jgi:hypothetical protein